jgi:hypothetical protein
VYRALPQLPCKRALGRSDASVAQSVVRVLGKDEVGSSILPGGSSIYEQ